MLSLYDKLVFLIEETLSALRRNSLMALAAVSTAAIALMLFGGFVVVAYGLNQVSQNLPKHFEFRVVMTNQATDKQVGDTEKRIQAIKDVYAIDHQTKDENWQQVKKEYEQVTGDLSGLENPLPDTFTFKVKNLERSEPIAAAVKKMPGVEDVQYLQQEQKTALKIAGVVQLVGAAAVAILFLAAMVLIFNTIRLTVMARQREIRVMQLVGATSHTIRGPFILEAVVQGALGGLVAAFALWYAAHPVVEIVNQFRTQPFALSGRELYLAATGLMLCGALLGSLCGMLAVRRYLKV